MAVVWRKRVNESLYEVRKAGASIRLYTNGVFHSQYNPSHPFGNNIWDLLLLPAFAVEPDELKGALVLGVGGGAVMRQLHEHLPIKKIVGVDIDKHHLHIANRYFGVHGAPFKLIRADAVKWIGEYAGKKFNLIIEDLYGDESGLPVRAVTPDARWFNMLSEHLAPEGILVMNYIDRSELKRSAWFNSKSIRRNLPYGYCLTMDAYENSIAVFMRHSTGLSEFKKRLAARVDDLASSRSPCPAYHIRRL